MSGRTAPRPKRGGEEFTRTFHSKDDEEGPSKKTRFDVRNPSALAPDVPEEDAVLEADEIGKRGQKTKRNAVNIDGYESDSSNEGFNARAAAKVLEAKQANGTGKPKMDEDSDMFADQEEFAEGDTMEDKEVERKKNRKEVKLIEVDNIEGQVANSKSGGHVHVDFSATNDANGKGKGADHGSESSSDSDVDDEKRAELNSDVDEEVGAGGKKKHAPKLDAFNLRAEREEGGFDDQLNYVRKAADPNSVHDSWLQGVSKKEIKKAREAHDKREMERRQKRLEDDSILTGEILKTLIPYLERGETVLEALARLGRSREKKKPKWQQQKKSKNSQPSEEMDIDSIEPTSSSAEIKRKEAVEAITDAADRLLTRGQNEIYDADRETLMRQYLRETGEEWRDPSPLPEMAESDKTKQWEYRWSGVGDGRDVHGPFDGAMMVSWNDAGYFGDDVEFRRAGDAAALWSRSVDFV